MRFVTDETIEPAQRAPRGDVAGMVAELSEQPGRWAEVARYPQERERSAWSRGSQTCRRYPTLDYAVRREGSEAVLYFRITPEVYDGHTDNEEPKP